MNAACTVHWTVSSWASELILFPAKGQAKATTSLTSTDLLNTNSSTHAGNKAIPMLPFHNSLALLIILN